ncbi:bi-domain-containing oxidoreductase [archaeon]|nr:bi-domain-containing oxidoreductase [archaeon]
MKQILRKGDKILVQEVPAPTVKDGYAIVRTAYSLISTGSELGALVSRKDAIFRAAGDSAILKKVIKKAGSEGLKSTYNQILKRFSEEAIGYSCSGVVLETGREVKGINVGDKVACSGTGFANHAEINCVPKNLIVKVPDGVGLDEAAFVSLGSIALHGIRKGDCSIGDNVVVIGLGLVGQLAAQIANAAGCHVIGIDKSEERVKSAKEIGLKKGIVSSKDLIDKIINLTKNEGADAVIICASAKEPDLIKEAVGMCRKGGKLVIIGNVNIGAPWGLAYAKEIKIIFSCSYGPGRYDADYEERGAVYPAEIIRWTETRNMEEFLEMIKEKRVNVSKLIGRVFDLNEAEKAYKELQMGRAICALINYATGYKIEKKEGALIRLRKAEAMRKEKISLGLIGAGGLAQAQHLPNIKKIDGFNLLAIADINGITAKKMAKEFKAGYATTDYKELLADQRIDAVVIATRHDSHAKIAIECIKAQKHVLLEKPLALNFDELNRIAKTLKTSNKVFSVGFNRRYADIAREAKRYMGSKQGPCIITYRVNALAVPVGHWFNSKEGGGRIIGEGCHFFDWFNWFIESRPKSITARGTTSGFKNIFDENNIIATVKYEDGSIAGLCYNEMGSSSLPKERIEVFRGSSNVVIDDYKEILLDEKKIRYNKQDKGHYNELIEFLNAIKGRQNCLLNFNDACLSTVCTLKAMEGLRTGKEIAV